MKKQAGVILALAVAVLLSACGLAERAQNDGKDENAEKTAYAGEEPEKSHSSVTGPTVGSVFPFESPA